MSVTNQNITADRVLYKHPGTALNDLYQDAVTALRLGNSRVSEVGSLKAIAKKILISDLPDMLMPSTMINYRQLVTSDEFILTDVEDILLYV